MKLWDNMYDEGRYMAKYGLPKVKVFMASLCFACMLSCTANKPEPIFSKYNIYPEDEELSNAIYMMNYYGTPMGLDLGDEKRPGDRKNKIWILERSAYIRGDTVQLLRYLCWAIEPDASIRKMFMDQWLSELREEGRLPPFKVVIQKVNQTISFYDKRAINARDKEIHEVYSALKKKNIKKRIDMELRCGADFAEGLKPLVDSCQPMGSVLFCGDKKRINEAYQNCLVARGVIKSVNLEIPPFILENQRSCDEVLCPLIYKKRH